VTKASTDGAGSERSESLSASEGSVPDSENRADQEAPVGVPLQVHELLSEHCSALIAHGLKRRSRVDTDGRRAPSRLRNTRSRSAAGRDKDSSYDEEEETKAVLDLWFDYLRAVPRSFCNPENVDASVRDIERDSYPTRCPTEVNVKHETNEVILFIFKHKC
jgi:hypothetical protein